MKYTLLFVGIIVIIIIVFSTYKGFSIYKALNKGTEAEKMPMQKSLLDKKIAIVITFRDFRDVEYFIPRDIFERAGAKIFTVSPKKGIAIGADGGEVNVDLEISEFKVEDFDAVVFIGGPGMPKKLDDTDFQKIAQDTAKANKVLGAICISPALLAKAGVLEGKKATVWSHPLNKEPINILKRNGAIYEAKAVVVDGKIVTGNGPEASEEWAKALIEVLAS